MNESLERRKYLLLSHRQSLVLERSVHSQQLIREQLVGMILGERVSVMLTSLKTHWFSTEVLVQLIHNCLPLNLPKIRVNTFHID